MKMTDPLLRRTAAYCAQWNMLPPGGTVLCAVSGGRDSMALLHILSRLAAEIGFQLTAAHFHHGLRETADRDEAFVRAWCRGKGIPLTTGRGDVKDFARREGMSVEDAARTLRYAFLESAAEDQGADRIAAAHHREDNAETVLLHLLRGAGPRGLSGIPPVRGKIVRPLLEASRDEINRYIQENALPYVEDETNQDTIYTRNRLRLEVLPLLEEISPGCGARMASAAALLREEDQHLQREAVALLPPAGNDGISLPLETLRRQDKAIQRRLVRTMAQKFGADLTQSQTEAVLSLPTGGFQDLSSNLCAVKRNGRLTIAPRPAPPAALRLREGRQTWGPWLVSMERAAAPVPETRQSAVLRGTSGELSLAPWDGTGRLAVANGARTIKRLFADAGIPVERRAGHPAILLDGKIAAIVGVAVDWNLRPRNGEPCWVVTLEKGGAE